MNLEFDILDDGRVRTSDFRFAALLMANGFPFVKVDVPRKSDGDKCGFVLQNTDDGLLERVSESFREKTAVVNAWEHSKSHSFLRAELNKFHIKSR